MNDISTGKQNHIAELAGRFLPNPDLPIESQLELTLFAMLVKGEAEDQGWQGKLGVAHVVWTRHHSQKFGRTLSDVILRPLQFSCFNQDDPGRKRIMTAVNNAVWQECFEAAWRVYQDDSIDPTGGADHYCRYDCNPSWKNTKVQTCQIGDHCFFRSSHVV